MVYHTNKNEISAHEYNVLSILDVFMLKLHLLSAITYRRTHLQSILSIASDAG